MTAPVAAPAAWSALLAEAVAKPGIISDAYSRFWNYSVGNQLLALWQCATRGIPPGPINTFLRWKDLGRHVKKGEKALTLCMPVTIRQKHETHETTNVDKESTATNHAFTRFLYRSHWFTLGQTEGDAYQPQDLPSWNEERALVALGISRVAFDLIDGNVQGFARALAVSVSPIAFLPHRTLFHELAHVLLGHTAEHEMTDDERTPRSLREAEAESVALICSESLGLAGADFSRGYIQHWLRSESIPERSAHRIFKAADRILRAGRAAEEGGIPCP